MTFQPRSQADYAQAARNLMPRGRVWPADADTVQTATLQGLGGTFARSDAAAVQLLADAFPATTVALLDEWEASLGLPDPCVGPDATVPQRQGQLVARLVAGGGQSAQRFEDYAADLGFTISITVYAPCRAGIARAGDPCYGLAWQFAWGITILANTSGLAPSVLLCELNAIKPAETVVFLIDS